MSGSNVEASAGAGASTSAQVPTVVGGLTDETIPTSSDHGGRSALASLAVGVIGGVALMALLLGAVAAFLMVQDRLDRRDPKLLAAALGSDQVPFS